ncbi:MAG: hypothetical protein ACOCQR_01220 [bacterium]
MNYKKTFCIFALFLFISCTVNAQSLFEISSEALEYDMDEGVIKISQNVKGQIDNLYIFAKDIVISVGNEKNNKAINEVNLKNSKITGCDLEEKPHYFFKASKVVIYPNDYLVIHNASFWELQGKIPLFYWPYLRLSLKEEANNLVPQIGHNSNRGWFAKTTYNYWYKDKLPGEIYLDYYTISGVGLGFKQFIKHRSDSKISLQAYGQQDKTNLGLYKWRVGTDFEHKSDKAHLEGDIKYFQYSDKFLLKGNSQFKFKDDVRNFMLVSKKEQREHYSKKGTVINEDYLKTSFERSLNDSWEMGLSYVHDIEVNPTSDKGTWDATGFLKKSTDKYQFSIETEKRDHEVNEEQWSSYYRLPQLSLKYNANENITFNNVAGRYYENSTDIRAKKIEGKISYQNNWSLLNSLNLSLSSNALGRVYEKEEMLISEKINSQIGYDNTVTLRNTFAENVTFVNQYTFSNFEGYTPFLFDELKKESQYSGRLNYSKDNNSLNIQGGYSFLKKEYSLLRIIAKRRVTPNWVINGGTSYDVNRNIYNDLYLQSRYENDTWEINTGIRYDLNRNNFKRWDNSLVFNLEDNMSFKLNNSLNYENNEIDQANLVLEKNFHCRKVAFSYDYLDDEFMFTYSINLFPNEEISIGSSSSESFIFESNIEDLLK